MLRDRFHVVIQISQLAHPPFSPSLRWIFLGSAAVVCGVVTALPFWVGTFVPLLDYPQHLALATVLHAHGTPSTLDAFFQAQWHEFTPYWSLYVLLDLVAFVVPMETAGRVVLTLYAMALPWAGIEWCRASGSRAEAGLLVSALALNTNLYMGFVNFCLASVLGLVFLALLLRQIEGPRRLRAALLATLAVALFFTHVQVLASCMIAAAAMVLLPSRTPWRRRLLAVLPALVASCLVLLPWLYVTLIAGPRRDFGSIGDMHADFIPLHRRVIRLGTCIAGAYQDRSDTLLLIVWAAAILGLLALWGRTRSAPGTGRVWLLLALAALGYLVTPFSITGQWAISIRFALLGALLLPALLRPRTPGQSATVALLALSLATAVGLNAVLKHRDWNREARGLAEAVASIPPGRRLASVIQQPAGSVLSLAPYLHVAQYYTVRRRGVAAGSFAASGPLPVGLRPAGKIAEPGVWGPQAFRCDKHLADADYLLTRGAGPCNLPLLFHEGDWYVFRVPHGRGYPAR